MEDDPLLEEDLAAIEALENHNDHDENKQSVLHIRQQQELAIQRLNHQRLQVRINAARNVGDAYASPSKLFLAIPLIFYIPQVLAVAVLLPQHWSMNTGVCDKMLQIWVLVHAIRLLLVVACWFGAYSRDRTVIDYSLQFDRFLTLFGVVWFILGNVWFYHIDPSASSTPSGSCHTAIYSLSRILLICSYIPFLLPCLILILLIPVVWCCLPAVIRFLRYMIQKERGADDKLLESIPSTKFQKSKYPDQDVTCSICLVPYNEDDPIRSLPCPGSLKKPHMFHQECVDTWLRTNATCPLCRFNLKGNSAPRNDGAMIV